MDLRPSRGGFLRPFGCGWFIREFLSVHGPNGSPRIDSDEGTLQSDIFSYYKTTLLHAIAVDRATREEEQRARRDRRTISPEEVERLTERYLAHTPPPQVHQLPLAFLHRLLFEPLKIRVGRTYWQGRSVSLSRPLPTRATAQVFPSN